MYDKRTTIYYFQDLLQQNSMPEFEEFYAIVCYPNYNFEKYSVQKIYAFIETMQKHPQVGKLLYPLGDVFKYLLAKVDHPTITFSGVKIQDYFLQQDILFYKNLYNLEYNLNYFFEYNSFLKLLTAVDVVKKQKLHELTPSRRRILRPQYFFKVEKLFMYLLTKKNYPESYYFNMKIEIHDGEIVILKNDLCLQL